MEDGSVDPSVLTAQRKKLPAHVASQQDCETTLETSSHKNLNQASPGKERNGELDHSQRNPTNRIGCNCRNSQCLTPDCKCFDDEYPCGSDCTCETCFNKDEYDDIIKVPKVQIDLRDVDSAERRNGCGCKRCGCRQRYCGCYQHDSACTAQCRCEYCQNPLGRRPG